jgi:hypothetical protein
MPAPTPMPTFAAMLRPEVGVGEDAPFGTKVVVVAEDETEETLVDVVGTNDDELEEDETEEILVNVVGTNDDELEEDETEEILVNVVGTNGDELEEDETEEILVDVVGTDDDELEDDDTFNVILNPRLFRVPLMKPLPVPVCPLGSWISRTKSGSAAICSSLMLSLSPIVHSKTSELGASAGAMISALRREQRFLLEYSHSKAPITILSWSQCDTSNVIYCNEVSQVISTVCPSV